MKDGFQKFMGTKWDKEDNYVFKRLLYVILMKSGTGAALKKSCLFETQISFCIFIGDPLMFWYGISRIR